jgi:hypothetical protein
MLAVLDARCHIPLMVQGVTLMVQGVTLMVQGVTLMVVIFIYDVTYNLIPSATVFF